MASKTEKKVNKSQLIRELKRDNPNAGPTEISQMLQDRHGLDIKPGMISTVLSQDRIRGGKPRKRGRPPKGAKRAEAAPKTSQASRSVGDLSVDSLVKAKELAEKMGGISEAKAALDVLSRIMN